MADLETISGTNGGTAGSGMAAEAPAPGQPVPANQPQPVADSRLAGILARKSAGEKLSAADRGYLGAVKRRGSPKKSAPVASENILLETPAPAENELFEIEPQAKAPARDVVLEARDSETIRNAAHALLDTLDSQTKFWIAQEAKSAGADDASVAAYETAGTLQPRNRQLMADGADPVVLVLCKVFRCSPEKLPDMIKNCGFIIGLGAHLFALRIVFKSIRESKAEREANQPAQT